MPWLRSNHNHPLYDDEELFYGGRTQAIDEFTSPPPSPVRDVEVDDTGVPKNVEELIQFLNDKEGLKLFKKAYRENMEFKRQTYNDMAKAEAKQVEHEKDIIRIKLPELKRISGADTSDNWNIFDKISERYMAAKDRQSIFEQMTTLAAQNLESDLSVDEVRQNDKIKYMRDKLVDQLTALSSFSAHASIVATVVDIVSAFIKNPRLIQTKFMNFMMVGPAGTGKTTLAGEIAKTLARAGMFVGDNVAEAGRAEFVGEYEGQTVARTRNFLVSNLDRGVIFVDEAYALTQWNKGKPEGYGSEAITAMVEFMTKYKGLYCIIVAGYEKEMSRYFLPTNPGLTRRFPYRFVLQDLDSANLLRAFQKHILKEQGAELPKDYTAEYASKQYFTQDAWDYLSTLAERCTQGKVAYLDEEYDSSTNKTYYNVRQFVPTYPLMYTLFENQAGSMTNLAEEAILVLMRTVSFKDTITYRKKPISILPPIRQQDRKVMQAIIRQRIYNSALSQAAEFLEELALVEATI